MSRDHSRTTISRIRAGEPKPSNHLPMHFVPCSGPLPLDMSDGSTNSMVFSKGHLLACDGTKLVTIDPTNGVNRVVKDGLPNYYLCNANAATGDILLSWRDTEGKHKSLKMNPETFDVTPINAGSDLFSEPCFIGVGDEIGRHDEHRLERVSSWGNVIESIKVPAGRFSRLDATEDGLVLCSKTGIFFWQFGTKASRLLAGHTSAGGVQRDGTGWRARFGNMRTPVYDGGRFLFVRDSVSPTTLPSRFVRFDVATDEARSLDIHGFDLTSSLSGAVGEDTLYLLVKNRSDSSSESRPILMRAPVQGSCQAMAAMSWRKVDLSQPANFVMFKLSDGNSLYFDPRILAAHSSYFKSMFTSGFRESADHVVDLRADTNVDRATLEDLLCFIATSSFDPSGRNPDQALRLWRLADKYQVQELQQHAEVALSRGLSKDTVLKILGQVHQSGNNIEKACWSYLEKEGGQIIHDNEDVLPNLITENPSLAQALMMWSASRDLKRRRKT